MGFPQIEEIIFLSPTGLDDLVTYLTKPSGSASIARLSHLLSSALHQLEEDDTLDPHAADRLAEAVTEAQERIEAGTDPSSILELLVQTYDDARSGPSLADQWLDRAEAFDTSEIRTETWDHFQQAVAVVREGRGHLVKGWVRHQISHFESTWASYGSLYVADEEITIESQMCHEFLKGGIESWLRALRAVASGSGDLDKALLDAEWGQRQLIVVQLFEAEAARRETPQALITAF